jgi:hypothetical protein
MQIEINRRYMSEKATFGDLSIDGEFCCLTLEDLVRDLGPDGQGKVFGETAIPAGTYEVVVNKSPKFGRDLPRLLNVPGFTGILIHKGNRSADTHGCILVGMTISGPDLLLRSTEAFNNLFARINSAHLLGQPIRITIRNGWEVGGE